MDSLNRAFGRVLARLRRQHKMSQEALAFEIDLTRTYVSLLERGRHSPTLDTMSAIARELDLPLDQLIALVLSDATKNP